jgi:hypothetical protein
MGVAFVPASLSLSLVGPVVWIAGHFVSLPTGLSGPLAGLVGTEPLGFDTWIRQKKTPAMGTSNVAAHDFLLSEAMTLSEGLKKEEQEPKPKHMRKKKELISGKGRRRSGKAGLTFYR